MTFVQQTAILDENVREEMFLFGTSVTFYMEAILVITVN